MFSHASSHELIALYPLRKSTGLVLCVTASGKSQANNSQIDAITPRESAYQPLVDKRNGEGLLCLLPGFWVDTHNRIETGKESTPGRAAI